MLPFIHGRLIAAKGKHSAIFGQGPFRQEDYSFTGVYVFISGELLALLH